MPDRKDDLVWGGVQGSHKEFLELSDAEFPEVIATFLGRESPVVRRLAGRIIPCGRRPPRGQPRQPVVCDPHSHRLQTAVLPGPSHTECHDACGSELFDICTEARLQVQLQPSTIFASVIPTAVLTATGRPPSIVPDAAMTASLPAVVTARGIRRGPALAARRLLSL